MKVTMTLLVIICRYSLSRMPWKFPDLIHAAKPEPDTEIPQAATAHDTFWDFISLSLGVDAYDHVGNVRPRNTP